MNPYDVNLSDMQRRRNHLIWTVIIEIAVIAILLVVTFKVA